MRARGLAAWTEGPVKLIFGHKMYLWCHSGKGYLKIQNSKILAPCWEFLITSPRITSYVISFRSEVEDFLAEPTFS